VLRCGGFILLILAAWCMAQSPADFDGNGAVDLPDLSLFVADWLTEGAAIQTPACDLTDDDTVDLADFTLFAAQWGIDCDGTLPTVPNLSAYILRGSSRYIHLTATDDGLPDPPGALVYQILSLPAHGTLYDPANTDPAYSNPDPENPAIVEIESVPYTLVDSGARVLFESVPEYGGQVTFAYSAGDGGSAPCGGTRPAIVTVELNGPPHAIDSTASVVAYEPALIDLVAEDNGLPSPPAKLKYYICTLPQNGTLQDIRSGAGIIYARHLPARLSSWAGDVLFWSETAGTDSFTFKANDSGGYPSGGDSLAATVTVNVAAHPRDLIALNRQGTITFSDHDHYDIKPGFAIRFWLRTRQAFGMLACKRGVTGPGYIFDLTSGRLRGRLYDAGGLATEVVHSFRVDDGDWHYATLGLYSVDSVQYLAVDADEWTITQQTEPGSFANNANLVIGGFKGSVDKIRFFNTYNPSSLAGMPMEWNGRNDLTEYWTSFGTPSVARYMCNEGSGLSITDDKLGLIGTLGDPNHARWYPFIDPFVDVSTLQHVGGRR
jgi:hypothetical protein